MFVRTTLTLAGVIFAFAQIGMAQSSPAKERTKEPASTQTATHAGESSGLAAADRRFLQEAYEGGTMEVELGNLAIRNASDSGVKAFGQRMVTDHSKVNQEVEAVAKQKGVTLHEKAKTETKQEKRLESLKGAEFDRTYARIMVQDHQKDVAEFRKMAMSAKDPAVKDFAAKTLPTLEDHLKQARELAPYRASKTSTPASGQTAPSKSK